MWRVFLTLIAHRFLLLVVALSALYFSVAQQPIGEPAISPSQPVSALWDKFLDRVATSKEAGQISGAISSSRDPFIWIGSFLHSKLGFRPDLIVLVLSNLFLFLFLLELQFFVNSLALPDVAVNTCILAILWLTSYELSLGSSLSLSCFLTVFALRSANDDRWLFTGVCLGILALNKVFAIFLTPLLILILVGQNRYASADTLARKLIYLFVPMGGAIFWSWDLYRNINLVLGDSALFNLISSADFKTALSWTLTASFLGQTIALLVLVTGSIICLFVFSTLVHRLLPITLLFALLITTPYSDLASSALLVSPVFSGLAEACAPALLRGIQILLLLFGAIEVFNLF